MMRTVDLRGTDRSVASLRALLPRAVDEGESALDIARAAIAEVTTRGSVALREQAERFDGVTPEHLRVPRDVLSRAVDGLDPDVRRAVDEAIRRVRLVSAAQVPQDATVEVIPGGSVRQRWVPVTRVGLYVPGGKAVYPSSVIMNVVPAQVAGVASIALASPPQRDFSGGVHPTILATAALLDVDEVYAMGGAGAIGALAFGVADLGLDPVDVITGPGNRFVAAAKRVVRGTVGIDAEAGPTEIVVIADDTAEPRLIAADLISQAEHDELAASILITDSPEVAQRVCEETERQAVITAHSERVITALSGQQSAVILVDDLSHAVAVSNAYGPEHLQIQTADPQTLVADIVNAGAVFLGACAPVSLGDYLAGSNHVLPTVGQARFSSALGAYTFLRAQQVITYDRNALHASAPLIRSLADAENLQAHGDAVDARFAEGR